MPRPVADQVVVVTGASSGIGRATVRELAYRGAAVVAAARNEEALLTLADEVRGEGRGLAQPVVTDVAVFDEVEQLAATAVKEHGRIDTWVNGAAVHEYAWFEDSNPAEFATVLQTDVLGQVHGAYAALPHLIANDAGGGLIGISSVEGVRAVPLQAPYVTSKFALRGFYDTLRMEMAARHPAVKVTTIPVGQQFTELPDPGEDTLERASTGGGEASSSKLESSEKVSSVKSRSYVTELIWQQPLVKRTLLAAAAASLVRRLLR